MKIALVSDLHANLQAWRAVLMDIRSMSLDAIICLGDVVGYGPNPAELVASLADHANHCVLGNHDAALCGKIETSSFTQEAAQVIAWTRGKVGKNTYRYLASLPLTVAAGEFRCAHGEFSRPAFYNYIHNTDDAQASWNAVPEPLLFVGHTHKPSIAVRRADGQCRMLPAQDFSIEPEHRYLVNVGSVGQPRDGDARAVYCIYDQKRRAIFWRRLPFDLDAYRAALHKAGLPETASPFLHNDPLASERAAEDYNGFYPSNDPAKAAQGAIEVLTVDLLRRRVRLWRTTAIALLILAIGLGACLTAFWTRHTDRSRHIAGAILTPLDASLWPKDSNLLALSSEVSAPNESIPGWSFFLGDNRNQSIYSEPLENGEPSLRLQSSVAKPELRLISRDILVKPGTRVAIQAMIKKDQCIEDVFELILLGSAEIPDHEGAADVRFETLAVKSPNELRLGGWHLGRQTVEIPTRIRTVRMVIRCRFSGEAQIKDIRFMRRK